MQTRRLRFQRANRELSILESTLAGMQFKGDGARAMHDLAGLEVRAYHARRPSTVELATRRDMLDEIFSFYDMAGPEAASAAPQAIADVATETVRSLTDWSVSMSKKFGDAWDSVTARAREMITGLTDEVINKLKSGLTSLQRSLSSYSDEFSRRVKSATEHHEHSSKLDELISQGAALETESGAVIVYNVETNEFKRTGECMEDLKHGLVEKAKGGGQVHESRLFRRKTLSEQVKAVERDLKRLNEVAPLAIAAAVGGAIGVAITGALAVVGSIEVLALGLAGLTRWLSNRTCSAWLENIAAYCKKFEEFVHGAVGALWDTTIPDSLAASVYNIYLSAGGDPVAGDEGRKAQGDEPETGALGNLGSVFGKKTRRGSSPSYKEANIDPETGKARGSIRQAFGEFGSRRELSGDDLKGPENDVFRRNVKQRVIMIIVSVLLVKYIIKIGLSVLGATEFSKAAIGKAGVKSVEVGKTVAGEIGALSPELAEPLSGVATAGVGLLGTAAQGQERSDKSATAEEILDYNKFRSSVNAARERKGKEPLEGSELAMAYLKYKEQMGASPMIRRG